MRATWTACISDVSSGRQPLEEETLIELLTLMVDAVPRQRAFISVVRAISLLVEETNDPAYCCHVYCIIIIVKVYTIFKGCPICCFDHSKVIERWQAKVWLERGQAPTRTDAQAHSDLRSSLVWLLNFYLVVALSTPSSIGIWLVLIF
jgi:hypothetical protein